MPRRRLMSKGVRLNRLQAGPRAQPRPRPQSAAPRPAPSLEVVAEPPAQRPAPFAQRAAEAQQLRQFQEGRESPAEALTSEELAAQALAEQMPASALRGSASPPAWTPDPSFLDAYLEL